MVYEAFHERGVNKTLRWHCSGAKCFQMLSFVTMEQFLKGQAQELEALLNGQSTMIDWAQKKMKSISAS